METWLKLHPYWTTTFALWPLSYVLLIWFSQYVKPVPTVDNERLMTLLATIDDIVGAKIERFGNKANELMNQDKTISDGVIFREITQPARQMRAIVKGIWLYFQADISRSECTIRVALAKMGESHIQSYVCYQPEGEGLFSSVDELQKSHSGFSRAKARGQIIVLPDVQKASEGPESKRSFAITSEGIQNNEGSMICYPVRHRNLGGIPFVISILASKKDHFSVAKKKAYVLILDMFSKRIALEYGLQVLKEKSK